MILTITYAGENATNLGYLLHKSPFRVHSFEQPFGKTHVFYPEATPERCTAALVLEIDSIGLVRGRRGPGGEARVLEEYVNDRPYAASSFLSVAIARTFGSALGGKSKDRQKLAERRIPPPAGLGRSGALPLCGRAGDGDHPAGHGDPPAGELSSGGVAGSDKLRVPHQQVGHRPPSLRSPFRPRGDPR